MTSDLVEPWEIWDSDDIIQQRTCIKCLIYRLIFLVLLVNLVSNYMSSLYTFIYLLLGIIYKDWYTLFINLEL